MHPNFQEVAQILFSWGATYLLHSTVVIVLVWSFLKLRPATSHELRDLFWKAALVGGLATTAGQFVLDPHQTLNLITWKLSATPSDSEIKANSIRHTAESTTKAKPEFDRIDLLSTGEQFDSTAEVWVVSASPDAVERSGNGAEIAEIERLRQGAAEKSTRRSDTRGNAVSLAARLPGILSISAVLAILLGFVRHAWQTYRLSRRLAECHPVVAGPARQLLDDLLRQIPQAPQVLLVEGGDDFEPAALGIWRSTIILPRRASLELSTDELQSLLAHELAHLIRGDAFWLAVHRLFGTFLAFQPLNRLVRREWQRAAEFLCDRWAIGKTGQPLALARCLTEVASWRIKTRAPQASLAAVGRRSGLVERIENLLDWSSRSDDDIGIRRGRRAVAVLLVGLAVLSGAAPRIVVVSAQGAVSNRKNVSGNDTRATNESGSQTATSVGVSDEAGDLSQHDGAHQIPQGHQADEHRTESSASMTTQKLIQDLERDIAGLENELASLAQLLDENSRHSEIKSLLSRLRAELSSLKKRRAILLEQSENSRI